MKSPPLYYSSWSVIFMFIGVMVYVFWMTVYPFETVSYPVQPFPTKQKVVKVGDNIEYEVRYERHTKVATHLTCMLVGDRIYLLPETYIMTQPGKGEVINTVRIPPGIIPATYHIEMTASWQINPFRMITKKLRTEQFEVTGD